MTPTSASKVDNFQEHLSLGTSVNVTFLAGSNLRDTVQVCKRLNEEGFNPVPHIVARNFENTRALEIFLDLLKDNKDDFVILCGVSKGKVKEYFILPTLVVDKTLKESNRIYHLGKKRDGSKRKVTSHRAIFLQESKDHYWCGWRRKWSKYLNNWDILEK